MIFVYPLFDSESV